MKVILTNNTEITPIVVMGGTRFVLSEHRDTLSFVFPASESMTILDGLFTAENCESITIEEDGGASFIHKGYTIRAELSKQSVMVEPETEETPAVYEDRITVAMAQRNYMENQLTETQSTMNTLLGVNE